MRDLRHEVVKIGVDIAAFGNALRSPPAPCPACGGYGHGDPPKGRSKRYPVCERCAGKGEVEE